MFVAITFTANSCSELFNAAACLSKPDFTTADEAKKGAAALIAHMSYKAYFTNGYDILIIDMDACKIVSRAKTEIKTLEWKDTPTTT